MQKSYILILLLIIPLFISAQNKSKIHKEKPEEEDPFPKVEFGISFGTYIPNKYTANYYNGSPGNVNSIFYVFSNKYWYNEIRQELLADTFLIKELPQDMHYNISMMGGLMLRINLTRNNSVFLEGNYTRLKTDDVFTLEVDPQGYTFPDIRVYGIHGVEERVNIDLGYHRKFPVYRKKLNLFADGGFNINFIKVLESYININDREYSLINIYTTSYIPGGNTQEIENNQGGFGFGVLAGGGMGFTFTPQVGMEIGGKFVYSNVNLEGYDEMKPSGSVYIRFLFSGKADE